MHVVGRSKQSAWRRHFQLLLLFFRFLNAVHVFQGEHEAAIRKYTKALSYLADLMSPESNMVQELSASSAESAGQLKSVALPCLLNRAACSLKLHQPREAIMDCFNVLQTDGSNTKALFRKGQAHIAVRVSQLVSLTYALGESIAVLCVCQVPCVFAYDCTHLGAAAVWLTILAL